MPFSAQLCNEEQDFSGGQPAAHRHRQVSTDFWTPVRNKMIMHASNRNEYVVKLTK